MLRADKKNQQFIPVLLLHTVQVEWLLLVYWKDDMKETEAGKAPFNRHRSCNCSLMSNLSNIITEINKLNRLTRRIHRKTSTEYILITIVGNSMDIPRNIGNFHDKFSIIAIWDSKLINQEILGSQPHSM